MRRGYSHSGTAGGGYPDFIQSHVDRSIYITETQKNTARIHAIPDEILDGLFNQPTISSVAAGQLSLTFGKAEQQAGHVAAPDLPGIYEYERQWQGFSIELLLSGHASTDAGQVVLDTREHADDKSIGITLASVAVGASKGLLLTLVGTEPLANASSTARLRVDAVTDNVCSAALSAPGPHHVVAIVDAGPGVLSFVVDGMLCDGGTDSTGRCASHACSSGWWWLPPFGSLHSASSEMAVGTDTARTPASKYEGKVELGRVYTRTLRTSEAIGNWRNATGSA